MNLAILVAMLILIAIAVSRKVLLRHCGSLQISSAGLAFLGGAGALCAGIPFLLQAVPLQALWVNPYFYLTMLNGVLMALSFIPTQMVRKHSAGAAEYAAIVSIGLLAIMNFFLGEHLSLGQMLGVAGVLLVATAYFFKGHISQMTGKIKNLFLLIAFYSIIPGTVVQIIATHTHWSVYVVGVGIGMSLISLTLAMREKRIIETLKNPWAWSSGVLFGATEIAVIFIMTTQLPVTLGVLAMRMSMPIIIIISASRWHEGNIRNQVLFGLAGYAAMLPVILF